MDRDLIEERKKRPAIILIGDFMVDKYYPVKVTGVSPEAPVLAASIISQPTEFPGGAGNVLRNLIALGADVLAIGIGKFPKIYNLRTEGILKFFQFAETQGYETRTRYVDFETNRHLIRVDEHYGEVLKYSSKEDFQKVLESFTSSTYLQPRSMIISDYKHGTLDIFPHSWIQEISSLGGVKLDIFASTRGRIQDLPVRGISYWIPNMEEWRCVKDYLAKVAPFPTIRTEGRDGVSYFGPRAKEPTFHLRAIQNDIVDPTGAGDTFIAAFAVGQSTQKNTRKSVEFANLMSGHVVMVSGTTIPTEEQIKEGFKILNGETNE